MKITLLDSIIDTIDIQTSPYIKSYVKILLKPTNNEKVNSFKDFALSKLHDCSPESSGKPPTTYYFDTVHARTVISRLFQNNFISAEDRSNIEETIRHAEKDEKLRHQLTESPEKSFGELLEHMCSPWVEAILEHPATPETILQLLIFPLSKRFWEDDGQKHLSELLKEMNTFADISSKSEILDILGSINTVCEGKANLESSFTRMAGKLPSIEVQRQAISKYFISSYLKKFPELPVLEKFYAAVALWMMSDLGQFGMYLNSLKEDLIDALKDPSSRKVWKTFMPLGGLYQTIEFGIVHANFSDKELVSLREMLSSTYPHMGFNDRSQWLILHPEPREEKLKILESPKSLAGDSHRFLPAPKTTWNTKILKKELVSIFPEYKWKANATKNEARIVFPNQAKRDQALSEIRCMLDAMQPQSNITIKKLKNKNGKYKLKLCNVTQGEVQKLNCFKESQLSHVKIPI